MTKKTIIALSSCALAFVGILLVATFLDLEINIALANADSLFGQFFALFGEATAWLVLPVAGVILFQAVQPENRYKIWLKALWLVLTIVGWYLATDYFFDELVKEIMYEKVYVIVFALAFTALSLLGTAKIDKKVMAKLVVLAAIMLVALAISQLFTTVMKKMWSRQRFRNMPEDSYSGFTPWYKPNWFKNGSGDFVSDFAGAHDEDAFKSFPSGHTSAAAMSFLIIVIPEIFDKLKKYKVWFYVVPAVYTFAVALSRIVLRAHFLSDVLFGALVGTGSVFIARLIVYAVRDRFAKRNMPIAAETAVSDMDGE